MTLQETYIVGRNIARVLRDSTRTDEILETGDIVSRRRMTEVAAEVRATPEGRRLLADRPELNRAEVDFDALGRLPEGTLGRVFADHMTRHGLDADALNKPTPRADDPDAVYLMRRYRGNHDVWHALLGLGTAGHEEVLVHAFSHGQLRLPISVLVVAFGALKHMVLERRWRALTHDLRAMHRLGRDAAPLLAVRWEDRWDQPLDALRAELGLAPQQRAAA